MEKKWNGEIRGWKGFRCAFDFENCRASRHERRISFIEFQSPLKSPQDPRGASMSNHKVPVFGWLSIYLRPNTSKSIKSEL